MAVSCAADRRNYDPNTRESGSLRPGRCSVVSTWAAALESWSRRRKGVFRSSIHSYQVAVRVDHPILRHARPLGEAALDGFIAPASPRGTDLDDDVRRAGDVLRRDDLGHTCIGEVQEIGFDDIESGEGDVERCVEHLSDWMVFEPGPDEKVQIARDSLVFGIRRWRHVVLPVDQLVPHPIVGKQQEVVVGELHARRADRLHVVTSMARGHALIVTPDQPEACRVSLCGTGENRVRARLLSQKLRTRALFVRRRNSALVLQPFSTWLYQQWRFPCSLQA
jgi:hypothetical protein